MQFFFIKSLGWGRVTATIMCIYERENIFLVPTFGQLFNLLPKTAVLFSSLPVVHSTGVTGRGGWGRGRACFCLSCSPAVQMMHFHIWCVFYELCAGVEQQRWSGCPVNGLLVVVVCTLVHCHSQNFNKLHLLWQTLSLNAFSKLQSRTCWSFTVILCYVFLYIYVKCV